MNFGLEEGCGGNLRTILSELISILPAGEYRISKKTLRACGGLSNKNVGDSGDDSSIKEDQGGCLRQKFQRLNRTLHK